LVERTCRLMNLTCGLLLLAEELDGERGAGYSRSEFSLGRDGLDFLDSIAAYNADEAAIWRKRRGPTKMHNASLPENAVYLEICAKYGDYADELIDGLQDELARMGISLQQPD